MRSEATTPNDSAAARLQQLRVLRLRAKDSKKQNRDELYAEHARLRNDPIAAKKLGLKKSQAVEKLARLDATDAGEDFERKRAWDYSIEESQAWDKKVERSQSNKLQAGFSDYAADAVKQYERETAVLRKPGFEAFNQQEAERHEQDHTQLGPAQSFAFLDDRPDKLRVDALVESIAARDLQRDKNNSRRRAKEGDPGSYINDRNRKFNQKAARAYDEYTKEMRDSFERGTAQ
ncbi:pre-mRNA-splicing factor syf2 [Protomyces lactucae-debilis]|uniref:Pre-mRNA-splicing factor SYF2 n=1 Tax=Protomyces lactucae-debilis TaxID=2754530 RepID=A0A1Y2FP40_PROLT|nr:pre-mRNA-splicing factor syf2 [Protomyces lactucae-debilis]ORY85770.1 pre-mRNA-splicing factor syf2 [Protomyces lactucae-debilis]